MGLTLNSLPHEVVLSIVEWTAQLTLEDQLEQERLDHERIHHQHHHHQHGAMPFVHPPGGPVDLGDGLGPIPGAPAGGDNDQGNVNVGGMDFVQNLFGFLAGGPMPQATQAPGQGDGPENGGEDDTDDEMPPLEPLHPQSSASQSSNNINGHISVNTASPPVNSPTLFEGMPPLESMNQALPAPEVLDEPMPPLEPLSSDDEMSSEPVPPATQTVFSQILPPGSLTPPANPSDHMVTSQDNAATTTLNGENFDTLVPVATAPAAEQAHALPPAPFNLQIDGSLAPNMMGEFSPAAPSTASINDSLAFELSNMQESTSTFTSEDLADMPDLDAPTVHEGDDDAEDESDWDTEEEDMASDEDEDEDGDETMEMQDVFQGEETPVESDQTLPTSDNGADSVEKTEIQGTYEDGLPSCPYLPLSFVNRSFLNASRSSLYGRHVHLSDSYQAYLLLRTLTTPHVSVNTDDEPDADDEDARQQQSLSYLVRDLYFDVRSLISLGRGGAENFIQLIKLCTRLERLSYTSDLLKSAQKPLEVALAGSTALRAVSLRGGDAPAKDLMWDMRRLAPLLGQWPQLRELQVLWLKHSINGPLIPPPKVHLVKLSLAHCDIIDSDLAYLLKHSRTSLKRLDIHRPTVKLTRLGLAKALIDHGKNLSSLQLDVQTTWHPISHTAPPAEAAAVTAEKAAKSRYMMDGLIGHLPILSELKLSGSLVSTVLLARLPKSLTVLALEDNMGVDVRKAIALLKKKRTVKSGDTTKTVPVVAPKLQCFTLARSDGAMLAETIMRDFEKVFDQRKACVHWAYHSPSAVWRPDGDPPPNPMEMMGNLLGMGQPPPFEGFEFEGFMPMLPPVFP